LAAFHPVFLRLGRNPEAQQKTYRGLVNERLDPAFVDALRAATNGGWALGSECFRKEIDAMANRRAAPLPRGPKPKPAKDAGQMTLL
jgi:putative transposase